VHSAGANSTTIDTPVWTLGRWQIKPGNQDAFRDAWQAFANWTTENVPGAIEGFLLQDADDPNLFYSIGPWESAAVVEAWRARPEFGAFVAKVMPLCDAFEPHNMQLAAHMARTAR